MAKKMTALFGAVSMPSGKRRIGAGKSNEPATSLHYSGMVNIASTTAGTTAFANCAFANAAAFKFNDEGLIVHNAL